MIMVRKKLLKIDIKFREKQIIIKYYVLNLGRMNGNGQNFNLKKYFAGGEQQIILLYLYVKKLLEPTDHIKSKTLDEQYEQDQELINKLYLNI